MSGLNSHDHDDQSVAPGTSESDTRVFLEGPGDSPDMAEHIRRATLNPQLVVLITTASGAVGSLLQ